MKTIHQVSWSNKFEIKPDRWVYNPTKESRDIGQNIIRKLKCSKLWKCPDYYYHLRKGGHIKALSIHLNSNYFIALDISDFFGSISRSRVTRALKSIVGYEKARNIAKLSTVRTPKNYTHSHYLPYGFIQSPLLSSICLFDSTFGKLLEQISHNKNMKISVYMDDIIISSNDKLSLEQIYNPLLEAVEKSKFRLNKNKVQPVSSTAKVFNIHISNKKMEIEKDRFDQFFFTYKNSKSNYQKNGILSYVGSVNKGQKKLLI